MGNNAKVSAVIVAGGSSQRMGNTDKLFVALAGKTVLERSVKALCDSSLIDETVVVASEKNLAAVKALLGDMPKLRAVVTGGATRAESVRCGVASCSRDTEYFAIHDAARPFVTQRLIERVIAAAIQHGAAAPAVQPADTIKTVDEDGRCEQTLERSRLRAVQTPQVFGAALYRRACGTQLDAYDDCQLVERLGTRVKLVDGDANNFKLTGPEDIPRARRLAGEAMTRIGHGYDVHRFAKGRRLILGGVDIPNECGLLGHSDADVLIHSIMDALLGAAALGDIGLHFPDSDERFFGADSALLLSEIARLVREAGYEIANIDSTVLCQAPRLRGFIEDMRRNIADAAGIPVSAVSVKATTEEGLGFTGELLGIAAHAVALLEQTAQ